MSPAKREFVGYFLRVKDVFEGGVAKPQLDENSTFLYWELKAMFPRINPEGIEVEKEDYEMQRFCDIALMRKPYCDQVQRNLRERKLWSLSEFKSFISEKGVKTGEESNRNKGEANKTSDAAREGKSSSTEVYVKEETAESISKQKKASHGASDIKKMGKNKAEEFLNKMNKDLEVEISQLEKELRNKKEICQSYVSSTIDDGEMEVGLDKKIKDNDKKIKQHERMKKETEKKEWKKAFEAEVKKVEGAVVEAQKHVSDSKDKIETRVSKMKNRKNREMRLAKQGLRNITLRMIQNSKISFTVLDMFQEEAWVNQPSGFQTELNKLDNLRRLIVSSLESVTTVLEEQGGAQEETKEQIGVLVLMINKEEFDEDDEELFKVDVDDFMTSLSTMIVKMERVFARVAIVIPPATKGESKIVESLSKSIKEGLPEKTLIKDLWKEQLVLEKREKGGTELAEKFVNESPELMTKYSVRRILSWMANLTEEDTGEVHEICDSCGLIHFLEPCPPEFIEKDVQDIKMEQDGQDNSDIENGGKHNNEDTTKMEAENSERKKREIKKLDRGRERSRSPIHGSQKSENKKKKQGKERSRSRSPSTRRNREDLKEKQGKERSRSRSPSNRRNREDLKEKVPNFTEQCYKCLRDHTWSECTVKHFWRCRTCNSTGHHAKVHEAKKPETKEALKNMYGADFKFY